MVCQHTLFATFLGWYSHHARLYECQLCSVWNVGAAIIKIEASEYTYLLYTRARQEAGIVLAK